MATHTLDFERPLLELERQIEEMKRVASETAMDVTKELAPLEKKLAELRAEIYKNLTPMQRVQVARHPKRPYTLDYVNTVFTDFAELHGDRLLPRRDGDAAHPDHHGGHGRGRLGRGARRRARRPRPDARELGVLGDLPRRLRRDPLEGREPAGAGRGGAQDHGGGSADVGGDRRDHPGAAGRRPRRPGRHRGGVGRSAAPPRAPAPEDEDREALETPRREVSFDGRADREMTR